MADVVLIAGASRSGTTLLGSMIAQRPGTLHLGELRWLWDRGLLERWLCGCGVPVDECPVWKPTVAGVRPAVHPAELVEIRQRHLRGRQLPALARRCRRRAVPPDLRALADATERVITGAAELTGADLVVDSSKWASQALLLHHLTSHDVRVVHLVRDPRAVAHSWSREKPNPAHHAHMPQRAPWRAAVDWLWMNEAVDRYVAPSIPTLRITYRDLVTSPEATMDAVWQHLGRRPDAPGERVVEHTVSGNPMRFGSRELRPDMRWIDESPATTQWFMTATTFPLMRRYGYPLRPER